MRRAGERNAKVVFHVGLVLGMVPVLFVPLLWIAGAFVNLRRDPAEPHTYGWLTLHLAALDTLAAIAVAVALWLAPSLLDSGTGEPPAPEPPRIGAILETDPGEEHLPGVGFVSVLPGSPAETAGLLAGDRVLAVDGGTVSTPRELTEALGARPAGVERTLLVRRAAEELEITVTPVFQADLPRERRGFFEPFPELGRATAKSYGSRLASYLPALLLLLAVSLWPSRRGLGGCAVLLWIASIALGSLIVTGGVSTVFAYTFGGPSRGATLLGLSAGAAAILALSVVAHRRLTQAGVLPASDEELRRRVFPVVALGALYFVAFATRALFLALGIAALLYGDEGSLAPVESLRHFEDLAAGPAGALVFAASVVVLAPAGEELLFRGILLPWLARSMGAPAAVVTSAAVFGLVHPHYGPFMLVIFALGIVFGWARIRSGGLAAPILLHAMANALATWRLL